MTDSSYVLHTHWTLTIALRWFGLGLLVFLHLRFLDLGPRAASVATYPQETVQLGGAVR